MYQGFFKKTGIIRFSKNRYQELHSNIKKELYDSKLDVHFKEVGFKITAIQYNLLRYFVVLILVISTLTKIVNEQSILSGMSLLIFFLVITYPEPVFLGFQTPFGSMVKYLANRYLTQKDNELYRAILQLKNIAIAQKEKPLGADFILSRLMSFTKIIKPVFAKTLNMIRLGQEEQAREYFANKIGTDMSKEFANIIVKIDKINPVELVEQLEAYQEHLKEEKLSRKLQNQEIISDMIFVPVITNVMIIIVNFIVITIWLDSINKLNIFK